MVRGETRRRRKTGVSSAKKREVYFSTRKMNESDVREKRDFLDKDALGKRVTRELSFSFNNMCKSAHGAPHVVDEASVEKDALKKVRKTGRRWDIMFSCLKWTWRRRRSQREPVFRTFFQASFSTRASSTTCLAPWPLLHIFVKESAKFTGAPFFAAVFFRKIAF